MPREKKRGDNVASPRSRGAGQQAQNEDHVAKRMFAGEGLIKCLIGMWKNNATRD